jgi:hypothetical protein
MSGAPSIMIDLETLGQSANAAIVSIGAVEIIDNTLTGREFYRVIDLNSCLRAGLAIEADTLRWWMRQSDAARAVFSDDNSDGIVVTLKEFAHWLPSDALIWGNGSDFDNAILANAYRACALDVPWKFWNNRCYRTLKNQYPDIKLTRTGTHHNALDDARTQAGHLIDILNHTRAPA